MRCEICKDENDTTEHLLKCTKDVLEQNIAHKLTEPSNDIVKIVKQNICTREAIGYKVRVCIGEE